MTPFSSLGAHRQMLLCALLFFAAAAELAAALYAAAVSRRRAAVHAAAFSLLLLLLTWLSAAADRGLAAPLPWGLAAAAAAAAFPAAAVGVLRARRLRATRLSPDSVKEALDDLNAGICFSDPTGRIVLINRTMGALSAVLLGRYPQLLSELRGALDAPDPPGGVVREGELYRFPDGRIWQFRTVPLRDAALDGFLQTSAQDVTELSEGNARLRRDNEALRRTNEEMQAMYLRLADRIREQETLNLKMRIHDEIGASLVALSQIAGDPTEADALPQLAALQNAVSYLAGTAPPPRGTVEAVCRRAAEMGVEVTLAGYLPRGGEIETLTAAALSECVTNCVQHAHGERVAATVSAHAAVCTVTITNNGEAPAGPIAEGGGLSALRRRVEAAGGEMHLSHSPAFALILNLPTKETPS